MMRPIDTALDALHRRDVGPKGAVVAPGRIEALGKHTDYAGGRSLTCAVPQHIAIAFAPRPDTVVRLFRTDTGEVHAFALSPETPARPGHWSDYARAVARRAARDFGAARGLDAAVASDLPAAAGLSSSSALVVGCFLALADVNDLAAHPKYQTHLSTPEQRADYLGAVESGRAFEGFDTDAGVGTRGGSQDHAAILCSQAGHLGYFDYAPTRLLQRVTMPHGLTFVVAVSGVAAAKTGSARVAYNRAAQLAAEAVRLWNASTGRADPHLAAVVDAPDFDPDRLRQALRAGHAAYPADALFDRIEQFRVEHGELVPAAVDALRAGDLTRFGSVVDESQRLAETKLGNQVPETQMLARSARAVGAAAASAFGAGFGGSVWALTAIDDADAFLGRWRRRYAAAFPERTQATQFFTAAPGPAARPIAVG